MRLLESKKRSFKIHSLPRLMLCEHIFFYKKKTVPAQEDYVTSSLTQYHVVRCESESKYPVTRFSPCEESIN